MFIAILTYKKPLADVDKYLATHREFLDVHYAAGDLIASGPRKARVGGVIMLTSQSREDAEAILCQDPFRVNGIADYQLVEFTPTKFVTEELAQILK